MTFGYLKKFEALGGKATRNELGKWELKWRPRPGDSLGHLDEMVFDVSGDEFLLDALKSAVGAIEGLTREAQLVRTVEEK